MPRAGELDDHANRPQDFRLDGAGVGKARGITQIGPRTGTGSVSFVRVGRSQGTSDIRRQQKSTASRLNIIVRTGVAAVGLGVDTTYRCRAHVEIAFATDALSELYRQSSYRRLSAGSSVPRASDMQT